MILQDILWGSQKDILQNTKKYDIYGGNISYFIVIEIKDNFGVVITKFYNLIF